MNPLLSLMPWAIGFYGALYLSYELFGSHLVSYALAAFAVYYLKPVAGKGIQRHSRILKARQKFYFFVDKIAVLGSPVETIEYVFILSVLLTAGGVLILFGVYEVLPVASAVYRVLLTVAIAPPLALLYRGFVLYLFSERRFQQVTESSFDCASSYRTFCLSAISAIYIRRSPLLDGLHIVLFRVGKTVLWLLLLPLLSRNELDLFSIPLIVFAVLNLSLVIRSVFEKDHLIRLQRTVTPAVFTLPRVPYKEVTFR